MLSRRLTCLLTYAHTRTEEVIGMRVSQFIIFFEKHGKSLILLVKNSTPIIEGSKELNSP